MKFENTEVFNFEGALRGMRNPMNSWDRKDSYQGRYHYIIGENDLKLTQTLIKAGSEHRKFMRQIFVSVDITAPLYWWKEEETYKIGTTANSTSFMHKGISKPFELNDFEIDTLTNSRQEISTKDKKEWEKDWEYIINRLNKLRNEYLKTKNKSIWRHILQILPESYLQTRTVTMTYENVFNMIHQRMNHKLNEWSGKDDSSKPNFISWAKELPYAEELLFIEKKNKGEN